jgi:hypothetical protein
MLPVATRYALYIAFDISRYYGTSPEETGTVVLQFITLVM